MTKKVIYLGHEIVHYRLPIFRIIANKYDLVLSTSKKEQLPNFKSEPFKVIYIPKLVIGPFIIHQTNILRIIKNYDIVIGLQNLRCLDIILLSFLPFRKFKVVLWGIGVSASYTKHYDEDKSIDFLRFFFFKRADALIFYSSYPLSKYLKNGFNKNSLFVANNTVYVSSESSVSKFNSESIFLFVGSLYKEKGVFELLNAYKDALMIVGDSLFKLYIIGDGSEMSNIVSFVEEFAITENVIIKGGIYDEDILKSFYKKCILSISPNQAGLSVLNAMGHGVCFLTKKNAITGGELFNISNGKTGVLYSNQEELRDIIIDCYKSPLKYKKIGNNAKSFYKKHRMPMNMASDILKALEYVIS